MSGRIEASQTATFVGAGLVMLGAWLPWLTLFAGLQRYSGLIGIHGQLLFGGGALAMVGGLGMLRTRHRWIRWATLLLGAALLGFDAWLLTGLTAMLHRGLSAMLVPRAGPGLFVSSLGIALVIAGPGLALAREARERLTQPRPPHDSSSDTTGGPRASPTRRSPAGVAAGSR